MKNYKALIVYSSITGNTEQVAMAFAETFREYNIQPTLMKLEGNYQGVKIPEPERDSYDFLMFGSPVIASIPYHDLYIQFGAQDDYGSRNFESDGRGPIHGVKDGGNGKPTFADGVPVGAGMMFGGGNEKQHRIAFCTYGGFGRGPEEATATLELLKELNHGRGNVGFFACPGKIRWFESSGKLAELLRINQFRAQELIYRYTQDPDGPYFADMAPEALSLIREAATEPVDASFTSPAMADNDPLGIGKPGSNFWSYDLQNRPNSRDIAMAKAFLSDVIEDYYLSDTGEPRTPSSVYYCII